MNVCSLSCTPLFILIVTMTTRPILESWTQRQNLSVSWQFVDIRWTLVLLHGGLVQVYQLWVEFLKECVFMSTIFESIDPTPLPGFWNDYMPKCFMESGYGDTALIGDATEIWISQSENFDINNITFSNYKKHTTGKICLWTLPPGFFPQMYRCISWQHYWCWYNRAIVCARYSHKREDSYDWQGL